MDMNDAPASVRGVMATRVFARADAPQGSVDGMGRPVVVQGSMGLTYHAWLIGQIIGPLAASPVARSQTALQIASDAIAIADAVCIKIAESLKPKEEPVVQ